MSKLFTYKHYPQSSYNHKKKKGYMEALQIINVLLEGNKLLLSSYRENIF